MALALPAKGLAGACLTVKHVPIGERQYRYTCHAGRRRVAILRTYLLDCLDLGLQREAKGAQGDRAGCQRQTWVRSFWHAGSCDAKHLGELLT